MCRGTRTKHKNDKSLSIKVDQKGVQYQCHHCDANGGWVNDREWAFDNTPLVREPITDLPKATNEGRNQVPPESAHR
jgi:hypothetical protein